VVPPASIPAKVLAKVPAVDPAGVEAAGRGLDKLRQLDCQQTQDGDTFEACYGLFCGSYDGTHAHGAALEIPAVVRVPKGWTGTLTPRQFYGLPLVTLTSGVKLDMPSSKHGEAFAFGMQDAPEALNLTREEAEALKSIAHKAALGIKIGLTPELACEDLAQRRGDIVAATARLLKALAAARATCGALKDRDRANDINEWLESVFFDLGKVFHGADAWINQLLVTGAEHGPCAAKYLRSRVGGAPNLTVGRAKKQEKKSAKHAKIAAEICREREAFATRDKKRCSWNKAAFEWVGKQKDAPKNASIRKKRVASLLKRLRRNRLLP
jgi:hypothetical protein